MRSLIRRLAIGTVAMALLADGCVAGASPPASPTTVIAPATTSASSLPSPTQSATPTPPAADRYADGIPNTWQGQPVLRWDQALIHRDAVTDETPFLVGGWLDIPKGVYSCPKNGCQLRAVSSEAGAAPPNETSLITFKFTAEAPTTGPAIMRVHLHDPRLASCGFSNAVCDQMLVVDDIPWAGDAATAPHPLSPAAVLAAAAATSPSSRLLDPSDPSSWGCGADLIDGLLMCMRYATGAEYGSQKIAGAVVMPSPEALARALPDVQPGVDGALRQVVKTTGSISGPGYAFSWDDRWLVVGNVAVLLRTTVGSPSQADVDLMTALVAALKAPEAGSAASS